MMKVSGMPVQYFIYGLKKVSEYFHGKCTFSYVTVPIIKFERILINESWCLVIDAENVASLIAAEGESDKVIRLAEDVALERFTFDFAEHNGIHTECVPVSALLTALEAYQDTDEILELRFHRRLEWIDIYAGDNLISL